MQYLNKADMASRLRCSKPTLDRIIKEWRARGEFPPGACHGAASNARLLVLESDFEAWFAKYHAEHVRNV